MFRHGSPWKTQEVDWCHMFTKTGVRVVQNAANSMGNGWLRFYFRLVDDRNMTNQTIRLASRIVIVYCTCLDVARILSFFLIRQVPGEYVYIRIYIYSYIPYQIFRYQNDIICFHITSYHDTSHTNIELPKILNPQLGSDWSILELKAVDQSI